MTKATLILDYLCPAVLPLVSVVKVGTTTNAINAGDADSLENNAIPINSLIPDLMNFKVTYHNL